MDAAWENKKNADAAGIGAFIIDSSSGTLCPQVLNKSCLESTSHNKHLTSVYRFQPDTVLLSNSKPQTSGA